MSVLRQCYVIVDFISSKTTFFFNQRVQQTHTNYIMHNKLNNFFNKINGVYFSFREHYEIDWKD